MADAMSNRAMPADATSFHSNWSAPERLPRTYWRRMRPSKVYPVTVSSSGRWMGTHQRPAIDRRRPVVPAEQAFDTGNAKEKVTFYVTPLAKGRPSRRAA